MTDPSAAERWQEDRTTFQRVYDVVLGVQEYVSASEIADRAACSETAARNALEQLVEMGVAERRDGRPATYRRNGAYLTWKRVESLAREHEPAELCERVDELVEEDRAFQEQFGVPEPDAASTSDLSVDDHDALQERWSDLAKWRTIRRDVRVLRRAVERAASRRDDGARA